VCIACDPDRLNHREPHYLFLSAPLYCPYLANARPRGREEEGGENNTARTAMRDATRYGDEEASGSARRETRYLNAERYS